MTGRAGGFKRLLATRRRGCRWRDDSLPISAHPVLVQNERQLLRTRPRLQLKGRMFNFGQSHTYYPDLNPATDIRKSSTEPHTFGEKEARLEISIQVHYQRKIHDFQLVKLAL
jgi:hypothetical protein